MYIIMPIWSLSGFLDWLWHRQTRIETTSGVKESLMHLLMMAAAGAPILTGLFLEMNAGTLALMGAGWLAREMTVVWDVNYTISRRTIFPREQHTHGYMQTIPFDIIATMVCLHPEKFLSLLGTGPEKAEFKLRFRKPPVPLKDFVAIVACMGLLSGLPTLKNSGAAIVRSGPAWREGTFRSVRGNSTRPSWRVLGVGIPAEGSPCVHSRCPLDPAFLFRLIVEHSLPTGTSAHTSGR